MNWLARLFGAAGTAQAPAATREELPGLGVVRIARVVDCMDAMCPRPQLLTKKVLDQMGEGEVIEIVSDNAAAVEAFPWFAEALSCTHLMTIRGRDRWRIYLRKGLEA